MDKRSKILIVVALAMAVAVVILAKNEDNGSSETAVPPVIAEVAEIVATQVQEKVAVAKLVDLGAGTCIPCKMMAPILEELKVQYAGRFDVEFIDVSKDPAAGKRYGIKLIPTQIFFDADGKELFRHEGFYSADEILATWRRFGIEFADGQ